MKKWKFEKELATAKSAFISAYLATTAAEKTAIVFDDGINYYYRDLTRAEEIAFCRMDTKSIKLNSLTKKVRATLNINAVKICTVEEAEDFFKNFENINHGYLCEFLYRFFVTRENLKEIKALRADIPYYLTPDTKDGKQIKNIDKGATYTDFKTIVKALKFKGMDSTGIEKQIEIINTIYSK